MFPPDQRPEPRRHSAKRIVLTTIGSLGDLHPYIAIALGLKARGHHAIVATCACYREKIEALGLGFHAIRPDPVWFTDPAQMQHYMHPALGLLRVGTDWVLPALRESYADTLAAAKEADLLVAHPLTYATRLVAEKTDIPWVSTMPVPLGFFSAHELSVIPMFPTLCQRLRFLGPTFWGPVLWICKIASRFVAKPWYHLRAEIGLPPTRELNPLGDSHSPFLVLALFSKVIAAKQPDWPPQTVLTGFPLFDRHGPEGFPPELAHFLDAGPPPVVFTLGSAVALNPGRFFEYCVAAARQLDRRAVLIFKEPGNRLPSLPTGVAAFEYAPFSELFPRAAAIVHHGGVGTTGLALRAGRPQLIVPYAWDQPDHAERVTRLGVGRTLPLQRLNPGQMAAELRRLLEEPSYARRAAAVGEQVRKEDGVKKACDALEELLFNLQSKIVAGASNWYPNPRSFQEAK